MCTFCHQVFAHTHSCLSLSPQELEKRCKTSHPSKTALRFWPALTPHQQLRPHLPTPLHSGMTHTCCPIRCLQFISFPSLLNSIYSPFTPNTPMNLLAKVTTNSWIIMLSPLLLITPFLKHLHIWLPEHITNDFSLTSTDHISIPLLISLHFPKL